MTIDQTKVGVHSFSPEDVKAVHLKQAWAKFDLEKRQIPWIFSTDEVDHAGERIDQRGLNLAIFKTAPRLLWSHDMSLPAIGSVPRIQAGVKLDDGRRATIGLTQFATRDESQFADQIFALASPVGPDGKPRIPHINSTSVGVANTERELPDSPDHARKLGVPPHGAWIRSGDLVEVSVVNIGMCPGAVQPVLKAWRDAGVGRDQDIERFLGWEGLSEEAAQKALQARLRSFVDMAARPKRKVSGFDVKAGAKKLADLAASHGHQDSECKYVDQKAADPGPLPDSARVSSTGVPTDVKSFDVERQHLEAARLEHDWVSRWCSCEVKQLHQLNTSCSGLDAGSFLVGLRNALVDYQLVDTRSITPDGQEVPPAYDMVQCGPSSSEDFLVRGLQFMRGEAAIAVKYARNWGGGYDVGIWTERRQAPAAEQILKSAWEWAEANHFRRGQAFSLTGSYVEKTSDDWSGLFLTAENRDVVTKAIGNINAKGASMPSRGMIWQGPPGTGKTLTARVLCNQADATFIWCSNRDFMQTGTTWGIAQAMDLARRFSPAVVLFEDVHLHSRACDLLKTELDGLARNSGVTTIVATNHPEELPKALIDRPGRFHDVLTFDLPDATTRRQMIATWLPGVGAQAMAEAVKRSDGMSGAHVYELCEFAKSLEEQDQITRDGALGLAVEKVLRQRNQIGVESWSLGRPPVNADAVFGAPIVTSYDRHTYLDTGPHLAARSGIERARSQSSQVDESPWQEKLAAAISDQGTALARLTRFLEQQNTRGGGSAGHAPTGSSPEGNSPDASSGDTSNEDTKSLKALEDAVGRVLKNMRGGRPQE